MQLSKRLQAVAELVTPGSRVADVGCDHAYTSIYLIEQNIASAVIAMDVNQGPIERAAENIKKYGMEGRIGVRKSNGLQKLQPKEADTVLIAGMGGGLTAQILSDRTDVVCALKELILQPQSETSLVRKVVNEYGFLITRENMLIEDGKYYVMMKAEQEDRVSDQQLYRLGKEEHYHFGRLLLEEKSLVLLSYLIKEKQMYEDILRSLISQPTKQSILRQKEILNKLELINGGLSYYNDEEMKVYEDKCSC